MGDNVHRGIVVLIVLPACWVGVGAVDVVVAVASMSSVAEGVWMIVTSHEAMERMTTL